MQSTVLSPSELRKRMDDLHVSQTALSAATEISLTSINRYRKEHLQSLSVENLHRIAFVLEQCEFLTKVFEPIRLNFYDGDALLATLDFWTKHWLELQEKDLENYNPFLTMYPEPLSAEIQSL